MKSEPFNQWLSNLFLVGNLQPKSWNILLLIYRVALGTELFWFMVSKNWVLQQE
jgi:hypothetical protein